MCKHNFALNTGVHVTLPDYYSPDAVGMIVPKTKDGRVVFMLPWEGATIAGTTDSPSPITHVPQAKEEDVQFILTAIEDYLDVQVGLAGNGNGMFCRLCGVCAGNSLHA